MRTLTMNRPQHDADDASKRILGESMEHRSSEALGIARDELYGEFRPLVFRLLRQYGGDDRELRQDLTGEIYMRFVTLLEVYDPTRGVPLRPYLVRQLTASINAYVRRRWRAQRREVSLDVTYVRESASAEDPTKQWDERIDRWQLQQDLPDLIDRLPARQRQVLIWRYYEQRSFEEIAEVLNIRSATARSLLRHALNHLRRNLKHMSG